MVHCWHGSPWLRLRLLIVALVLGFWAATLLLWCLGRTRFFWKCVQDFLGPSVLVLLVVGGMPEEPLCCSSAAAPSRWVRAICSLTVLLVTTAVAAYPWLAGLAGDDFCEHWYGPESSGFSKDYDLLDRNRVEFVLVSISAWTITGIAMFCVGRSHQPSLYIRSGVRFLLTAWLQALTWMLVMGVSLCGNPENYITWMGLSASVDVGHFINAACVLWVSTLVVRGIAVLETSPTEGLLPVLLKSFTQQLAFCYGAMCILQVVGNMFTAVAFTQQQPVYELCGGYAFFLAGLAMVVCLLHVVSAFRKPIKILYDEARQTTGITAADALWAGQCLRLERKVILTSMVLAVCDLTMRGIMGVFGKPIAGTLGGACTHIFWILRDILHALSIAVLCGFVGKSKIDDGCHQAARDELAQTLNKQKCTLARHPASGDPCWHCKVEELAGRGFALADLLHFFEELLTGNVMPSFDPLRSTTNDVVRQAIIPLSRSRAPLTGGRALASVWSGGKAVWPERMVTHAWSNLHLHLVAAILADALGVEIYYDRLAAQLCSIEGLRDVRRQLEAQDGHVPTYWVCAFSVNQHAGICGGFGDPPEDPLDREKWMQRRVDTASGEPHPSCDCSEPKFFSNEPVQCEMNKFDDMLDLIMERVPSFRHVIAMDRDFNLLRRCWCLAEIVRTSSKNAPQSTFMLSAEAMDTHYNALRDIDVQECEASNAEDKKFILEKIPSIDHFNAKLKQLVFSKEGIFNRQLKCSRDRMQAAARVALRVDKSRRSRSRPHATVTSDSSSEDSECISRDVDFPAV